MPTVASICQEDSNPSPANRFNSASGRPAAMVVKSMVSREFSNDRLCGRKLNLDCPVSVSVARSVRNRLNRRAVFVDSSSVTTGMADTSDTSDIVSHSAGPLFNRLTSFPVVRRFFVAFKQSSVVN